MLPWKLRGEMYPLCQVCWGTCPMLEPEPSTVLRVVGEPIKQGVRWTNLDTDWHGQSQYSGPEQDAMFQSLEGSEFASEANASKRSSGPKRPYKPGSIEDSLTFSLTGSYSRNPSISEHRRAKSAHFGTSGSRSGPAKAKLGTTDPSLSQVVLHRGPPASIGRQFTSSAKNATVVRIATLPAHTSGVLP
jgi:hypothetical protein